MRVGLHIGKFHWPGHPENIGPKLAEIAKTADDTGFYSLWVMDHLFQLGDRYGVVHGPPDEAMLEGYSTIAYLAGVTQKIKIGLLVTCNPFRSPGLLVKTVSTIDVLSGGRAYLGLGAGWYEREADGLGMSLPPTWTERFEQLEETLQIIHQMWRGDTSAYEGKHYQLAEPINNPQPLSKPHPPILIGGSGEKKTLRMVAQYADACNLVIGSPLTLEELGTIRSDAASVDDYLAEAREYLGGKLKVLQQHCQDLGRSYDDIEKTVVTYIKLGDGAMAAAEVIDLCRELADVGFDQVIFNMPNVDEITPLEIMGREVIPAVSAL